MRSAYQALGHTIAGLVAVQAAVIAFAVMGLWSWVRDGHDLTTGQVKADNFDSTGAVGFALHSVIGMIVIPLLAIAMLVVAFRAGIDGGTKWAGMLLGAVVLQVALGVLGEDLPALGLLHGILALGIAWLGWHAASFAVAGEHSLV
ncbi:MAG: hypothetical protein JWR90_911 [Marmoricola sp.]|jgi:hypothetical protein|nr:hypothetical protein [Marmoricola sp.]